MIRRTHTKTYALMTAWAETTPHACEPGCDKPHAHVGDLCDAPQCIERLNADESCYSVTELERDANGREPWVCWRHIQPDTGPTRIGAARG
jgi:hypothetical protein